MGLVAGSAVGGLATLVVGIANFVMYILPNFSLPF